MSYTPNTDFLALLRSTSGGVRTERMPGLDYVVSALARAGLITLFVGQTAPTVNQSTTVWFQPAVPSWTAEGVVFLWNASLSQFVSATPALWTALLQLIQSGYSFQSAAAASNNIVAGTSLLAVQRAAPAATSLILPSLSAQFAKQQIKLQIVDFSTGVANHTITLSTTDGATIMQSNAWNLLSTPDQLANITFQPSPDLNAWVIV